MSDAEVRHVAARIHGRYLVDRGATGPRPRGQGDGSGPPLLIGCHGYGETAETHLEKLRQIPGAERWMLVAVQGLHRFYNKKGDVLASWMTRQDRDLAIRDNVRYLATVVAAMRGDDGARGRLVFAGFSQGVAMAYRAAAWNGFTCHGILALAGDVPPDVAADGVSLPPVLLGRGTTDAWYSEAKMEQDLATLAALKTPVETCVFDGGHDWSPEYYRAAGDFLDRVGAGGDP